MTQDEARSRIAKDTGNVTAEDSEINPRIMVAGPWCTTEKEALDALALEWMEGLE